MSCSYNEERKGPTHSLFFALFFAALCAPLFFFVLLCFSFVPVRNVMQVATLFVHVHRIISIIILLKVALLSHLIINLFFYHSFFVVVVVAFYLFIISSFLYVCTNYMRIKSYSAKAEILCNFNNNNCLLSECMDVTSE